MPLKEYKPGTAFSGVIGRTFDQSEPAWPEPLRAKEGAPNVLFIVLDDTGFGQLGCYGSPIETPNLDSLADGGLRYNNMHTTALCSPTRTCILTGRNHHSNAMAAITETSTGYPGYNGNIPFENGFLSEMLLQHGYNTYAIGKWHLTPAEQISAAGPYDRWPLGRGFERYYGFLGGDTHQYYPSLTYDNHRVEPNKTPEEGYHLTEDLADKAISFIADSKQIAPNKPFFMYFCTGAMHAPHHVPKEWADDYAGKFDDGWEAYREKVFTKQKEIGIVPKDAELSRHDPDVKLWKDCSNEEKKLYSRMMEVYAGFLTHTDHQIGRILEFLKSINEFENTLIMVISDNGASSEGGPEGSVNENLFFNFVPEDLEENLAALEELGGPKYFNHYPWGWTWAGNTPFRRWKRETYRGGVSDPFIVHYPNRIKAKGEIRTHYTHAIDMVPTVLEVLSIDPPTSIKGVSQSPIEGTSFIQTFEDPKIPSKRHTQYFEMLGHRSLYHKGWKAVCPWPGTSFSEPPGLPFGTPIPAEKLTELDANNWELYHIDEDFAENHNVADKNRAKLIEMIAQWYVEAGKYNVLPIDGRGQQRFADERPQIARDRTSYTYYPGTQELPFNAAAKTLNRPHSITADVEIKKGDEGILLVQGGLDGGFVFYVQDNKLQYLYNYVGRKFFHIESVKEVPEGHLKLRFEFEPTGKPDILKGRGTPARGQLYIDKELVGQIEMDVTTPILLGLSAGVNIGTNPGSPVTNKYDTPFKFTGKLHSVTVDVSGDLIADSKAKMRIVMSRQ